MFRYFVAWLTSKFPWMDDEKRAAQRARLQQLEEEWERDLELDRKRQEQQSIRTKRALAQMEEKLNSHRHKRQ